MHQKVGRLNVFILLLFLLGTVCARNSEAASYSETKLSLLPLSGESRFSRDAWSGSFFPDFFGGVRRVSPLFGKGLGKKWDQLIVARGMDRKDEPTLSELIDLRSKSHYINRFWFGLCNGWALASMLHSIPKDHHFLFQGGSSLRFKSAEIQAILSFFYATIPSEESFEYYGSAEKSISPKEFHLALTQKIGTEQGILIADTVPTEEVSNHPILRYESKIDSSNLDHRVQVTTEVWYLDYYWFRSGKMVGSHPRQKIFKKTYHYTLQTDQNDEVVGGEWLEKDHPDLAWTPLKIEFKGQWRMLQELLSSSAE